MQKNKSSTNAQGAIEYLLIIGAAILIVAVVIIALTNITSTATENTNPTTTLNPLEQTILIQKYNLNPALANTLIQSGTTTQLTIETNDSDPNFNSAESHFEGDIPLNDDKIAMTQDEIEAAYNMGFFKIIIDGEDALTQGYTYKKELPLTESNQIHLEYTASYNIYITTQKDVTITNVEINYLETTDTNCAKEGEEITKLTDSKTPNECCEGLKAVFESNSQIQTIGDKCYYSDYITTVEITNGNCVNCGDGICSQYENKCNCFEDCKEQPSDFNNITEFCNTLCTNNNMSFNSTCEQLCNNKFYKLDGTIYCENAKFGETQEIEGIKYTKRKKEEITTENASTTCTSGITDMSGLFKDTSFNGNITHWDTSNVTNMQEMFYNNRYKLFVMEYFNQNISNWNTNNVTNMQKMFALSKFNNNISDWNTSSVTNMQEMFADSEFNQDISKWNTSNVTNMERMFSNSKFDKNISNWNTGSVTNMSAMFASTKFNQDISKWNTSSVTNMQEMFAGKKKNYTYTTWWGSEKSDFNQNISDWNTGSVTNMNAMFAGSKFNQNISNWDVSNVTTMDKMFNYSEFNQDISKWNINNLKNTSGMFSGSEFNQPLNNWNTSSITNMSNMFSGTSFNQDISDWNTSNVTNTSGMFGESKFNQNISSWDVSNIIIMEHMFANSEFNQDISNWDTSDVNTMRGLFLNSSFNKPINNWNTSNVLDMAGMFLESKFNQPISNWDVSNVKDMSYMFSRSIYNQDIIDWNVSNVTNMERMFSNAEKFNQDLSNWNVTNITNCESFDYNTYFWFKPKPNFSNDCLVDQKHVDDEWFIFEVPYNSRYSIIVYLDTIDANLEILINYEKKHHEYIGQETFYESVLPTESRFVYIKGQTKKLSFINAKNCLKDIHSPISNGVTGLTDASEMFKEINVSSFTREDFFDEASKNITNMNSMFYSSDFNGDISKWNTSNVTDMTMMFYESNFNKNISNWDVNNVTICSSFNTNSSLKKEFAPNLPESCLSIN